MSKKTLADLAGVLGYEPTGYTARRGLTTAERVLDEKLAASQEEVEYNIRANIEDCRKYDERITLMADRQAQRRLRWTKEKFELQSKLEDAEARIEELTSWGRAVVERQNTLFPAYEGEEEGVQENDSTE